MSDLDALLIDYALGTIDPEERRRVDVELVRSPELRRELDEIQGALAQTVFALPAIQPSPDTRRRLFDSIEQSSRLAQFADRLGQLFDLARERMLEVFAAVASPSKWEASALPGQSTPTVWLYHFQGGPKVSFSDVGLVRMEPNLDFPFHRHLGDEYVFVLDGSFHDLTSGETHHPGELIREPRGSGHKFKVGPRGVLFATGQYGIEFIPEE